MSELSNGTGGTVFCCLQIKSLVHMTKQENKLTDFEESIYLHYSKVRNADPSQLIMDMCEGILSYFMYMDDLDEPDKNFINAQINYFYFLKMVIDFKKQVKISE